MPGAKERKSTISSITRFSGVNDMILSCLGDTYIRDMLPFFHTTDAPLTLNFPSLGPFFVLAVCQLYIRNADTQNESKSIVPRFALGEMDVSSWSYEIEHSASN